MTLGPFPLDPILNWKTICNFDIKLFSVAQKGKLKKNQNEMTPTLKQGTQNKITLILFGFQLLLITKQMCLWKNKYSVQSTDENE